MAKTSDDSVLMNIKDLFEMEADRRVEEATSRERDRAEAKARLDRERTDREQAIREARELERRRAEEVRVDRDRELDDRLAGLRAQLDEVRRDREEARLQMAEAVARPPQRSGRAGIIASVMAAASLVAALGAIYVSWPRAADLTPVPAPVVLVEEAPVVEPDAPEATVVEAPVEEPAPAAVASADPAPRPRPRPRPRPEAAPDDLASQLELGNGDGVLGDDFLRQAGN